MDEKELIGKIKELRRIKPNQNWVFLTKNRILGAEQYTGETRVSLGPAASIISVLRGLFWRPALKPAYAGIFVIFVLFGLFGFAQNSVPGDYLYSIKKIAEKSQTLFASDEERAQVSLELAEKRLKELTQIVEANQAQKLAPAIKEFQGSLAEAANNFSGTDEETVKKVVELRKGTRVLELRGVVIGDGGLEQLELESLVAVLENLIEDLENRSLTVKQELLLDTMKELVEQGEYGAALELYLINQ